MKDTSTLPSSFDEIRTLIEDCARYAEGLFSEKDVRKRHHLGEDIWTALGNNEDFLEKIENEKLRRIRTGAAKREKAQQLVVKGAAVLGDIMNDATQSARHRVDAIKTLDQFADTGPASAPPADERFVITINLGGDEKLRFNKSIRPNPHDVDPGEGDVIEHAPQELLPAIAAKNDSRNGGGSGEPL